MALLSHFSFPQFSGSRAIYKWLACWLLVGAGLIPEMVSAQPAPTEARVKSAFLYNFAKFVTWPSNTFSSADEPVVIGILGKDPLGADLAATVANKTLNTPDSPKGRPFKIRQLNSKDDLSQCQILFISVSEENRLPEILKKLGNAPVLTVGNEIKRFAQSGGIINFVKEQDKIRFEINVQAAKRADIKINSTLLNLAKIVRDGS